MFLPLAPINIDFVIYLSVSAEKFRIEREWVYNVLVKIPTWDLFASFQTDAN